MRARAVDHTAPAPLGRGLALTLLVVLAGVSIVWSAGTVRGDLSLFGGFVAVAFGGELLLAEARVANRVQFGVALLLVATAAGDGAMAAPIALASLAGRAAARPNPAVRWSAWAAVYPLSASVAWAVARRLPAANASDLHAEMVHLPVVVAMALSFIVINMALTSLVTATTDPELALMRLRQHGPRLLARYAAVGAATWAAVTICDLYFNQRGPYLILLSFVLGGLVAVAQRRRHLTSRRAVASLVAAVEVKDSYTGGHVVRVGALAAAIAGELGLPEYTVDRIGFAATVHDLGKITVPLGVLHCTGPLDTSDRVTIEQHAISGELLLRGLVALPEAARVAGCHHERWDGRGYPHGLAGKAIPLEARITAIADSWDAMTSDRPYRRALHPAVAWAEIVRGAGTQFDPAVVEAFARLSVRPGPRAGLLGPHDTTPIVC